MFFNFLNDEIRLGKLPMTAMGSLEKEHEVLGFLVSQHPRDDFVDFQVPP